MTGTVVLGIGTADRWRDRVTPGFVVADFHRNLGLLAVLMIVAHIATTVLDPYARITVRDVVIPFGASYRPVWLGLGVVAFEVMILVAATSLLRDWFGPIAWRAIHWTAYASWPLAVVHGLGTGSDAQAPWLIGLVASCVAAVVIALILRLRRGGAASLPTRIAAALVALATLYLITGWAFQGPFQRGWAARAGTPQVTAKPGPVHPGPEGFSDPLAGVMVRDAAGNTQISMRDTLDTALTIAIRPPTVAETLPVVTIARGARQLCTAPANVGSTLYVVCGTTRLTITLYGTGPLIVGTTNITGTIATSGPLN